MGNQRVKDRVRTMVKLTTPNAGPLTAYERELLAVNHQRCDDCGVVEPGVTCVPTGPPINECIHECAWCRAANDMRRRLDLEAARLRRAAAARAEYTRCA